MTHPNDDMIDALFAQARDQMVRPSDDLMARVLADADAVADARLQPAASPQRPGLWAQLMDAIGGWPSLGGLAAATVAGIWVGIAPPDAVAEMTASLMGDAVSVSVFPTETEFDAGAFFDG